MSLGVRMLAVCLLAACSVSMCEARSHGVLSTCDVSEYVSSTTGTWPYSRIGRGTAIMPWTAIPVSSSAYTLRTGEGAAGSDPTTYVPGRPMEIHFSVTNLSFKYIGIVLYAVNSAAGAKDVRVGTWQTIKDKPYQTFPLGAICERAVTHTNADIKPLHAKFIWTPDATTTGTVRFRALVKQGEQAKGFFYWPATELRLTQGTAPALPSPVTVVGEPGRCCADVCNLQRPATPYCHTVATTGLNSVATVDAAVGALTNGRMPYIGGCVYAGPPQQTAAGYVAFRSTSAQKAQYCPDSYVALATATPDVCFTAPLATNRAICKCSATAADQAPNTGAAEEEAAPGPVRRLLSDDDGLSNASPVRAVASLGVFAVLALVASSASFRSSRSVLVIVAVIALLSLAQPASAHNFIKSMHRAREASVVLPCQARLGNDPHVQVIAGQEFEVEWSTGHGNAATTRRGFHWLAIVAEKDLPKLKVDAPELILSEYIDTAPTSSYITDPRYRRNHIHGSVECDGTDVSRACFKEKYFNEGNGGLATSDPLYIERDPVYRAKARPSTYQDPTKVVQNTYLSTHLVNDRRVTWSGSAKYPWLLHVSGFANTVQESDAYFRQADIARVKIPAGTPPGNYVVWYLWAGYCDCVDVNVVAGTTPVANRYGLVASSTTADTFVKLDHCEILNIKQAATTARVIQLTSTTGTFPVVDNALTCLNDCKARSMTTCTHVQVVRSVAPAGAMPYTPNVPYRPWTNDRTDTGIPLNICSDYSVHARMSGTSVYFPGQVCNSAPVSTLPLTTVAGPDQALCFGLIPLRNVNNQVEEDYYIAEGPLDPAWYSTCYLRLQSGGFVGIPPYVYKAPGWEAGDQCVDCDFIQNVGSYSLGTAPDWRKGISQTCADCNTKNNPASTATFKLAGTNQPNAGKGGATGTTYAWVTGTPSACGCTGITIRSVTCQASTGGTVSESFCTAAKPLAEQPCTKPATCGATTCVVNAPFFGTVGTCVSPLATGATCSFTCQANYRVDLTETRCDEGVLSAQTCVAIPATCKIAAPVNGVIGNCPVGGLVKNTYCSFQCNAGYALSRQSTTCTAEVELMVQTCEPVVGTTGCTVKAPVNGALGACTTSLASGASCQMTCPAPYRLTGAATTCTNGVLTPQRCAGGAPGTTSDWSLAFNDEFNTLDTTKWAQGWFATSATQLTKPPSSTDVHCYDPTQVSITKPTTTTSMLRLGLVKKVVTCAGTTRQYAGGMISTRGKFTTTYGYIEARLNFPDNGAGVIANIPMFGLSGAAYPADGQIEIVNGKGGKACIKYISTFGIQTKCTTTDYSGGYQTFGVDWTPTAAKYYFNGVLFATFTSGITSAPQYLLFQHRATGTAPLVPKAFNVDWVRVWKRMPPPAAASVDPTDPNAPAEPIPEPEVNFNDAEVELVQGDEPEAQESVQPVNTAADGAEEETVVAQPTSSESATSFVSSPLKLGLVIGGGALALVLIVVAVVVIRARKASQGAAQSTQRMADGVQMEDVTVRA